MSTLAERLWADLEELNELAASTLGGPGHWLRGLDRQDRPVGLWHYMVAPHESHSRRRGYSLACNAYGFDYLTAARPATSPWCGVADIEWRDACPLHDACAKCRERAPA